MRPSSIKVVRSTPDPRRLFAGVSVLSIREGHRLVNQRRRSRGLVTAPWHALWNTRPPAARPAGSARAYAHVMIDGTIDTARSQNIGAVNHASGSGQYCVIPAGAAAIDTTTVAPAVTFDYSNSPAFAGFAFFRPGAPNCSAGQ